MYFSFTFILWHIFCHGINSKYWLFFCHFPAFYCNWVSNLNICESCLKFSFPHMALILWINCNLKFCSTLISSMFLDNNLLKNSHTVFYLQTVMLLHAASCQDYLNSDHNVFPYFSKNFWLLFGNVLWKNPYV